MWKYKVLYLIAVVASVLFYIETNQRQILILLLLLVVLFGISFLVWAFYSGKIRLEYQIQDSGIVYRNIPVTINSTTGRHAMIGRIIAFVKYENIVFGTVHYQQIILKPGKEKHMQYGLPFESLECGKVKITMEKAVCYDLLGLLGRSVQPAKDTEIIVYPETFSLQIKRTSQPEAKNIGEQYDAGKRGDDVTEVFQMRDYQEGDSIKSIHWKLSSKLDKLIVREFGYPSNFHTVLYYDSDVEEGISQEERTAIINGIMGMTASLSQSMVRAGYPHHVIISGAQGTEEFIVEENHSNMQMLSSMMSQKLRDKTDDEAEKFALLDMEQRFSKLVVVTGKLTESLIQRISEEINLTVICLSTEEHEQVESGRNYEIIKLPIEQLSKKMQMIEL